MLKKQKTSVCRISAKKIDASRGVCIRGMIKSEVLIRAERFFGVKPNNIYYIYLSKIGGFLHCWIGMRDIKANYV